MNRFVVGDYYEMPMQVDVDTSTGTDVDESTGIAPFLVCFARVPLCIWCCWGLLLVVG